MKTQCIGYIEKGALYDYLSYYLIGLYYIQMFGGYHITIVSARIRILWWWFMINTFKVSTIVKKKIITL